MKTMTAFRVTGLFLLAGACAMPRPAPAAEKVIEGFEQAKGLQTSGKVALVTGADAVTEGASALQLSPKASVKIDIPARSIRRTGWLRIDTFQVQPALATLQVSLGSVSREGSVQPGPDTLAVPLAMVAKSDQGPWPDKKTVLTLTNRGTTAVVLDNVRLAEPAPGPAGAVLLDFGPDGQVLWPGFDPAGTQGAAITWSGKRRIHTLSTNHPDALLGDFAGAYPGYKTLETLSITRSDDSVACVWLTHYAYQYTPPLEYRARLNGRVLVHRRLTPAQMLSTDGLLRGKDQPWTPEWFQKTFVPSIVSKIECALRPGALELANCQVAAMILAPKNRQKAMRAYVRGVEADLKRYRRQFVLARRQRVRCDVVPTEAESKAGMMLFLPPRDGWFDGNYVAATEHRAKELKLIAGTGCSVTAAIVAVPCADGPALLPTLEALRDPARGVIPPAGCRVYALQDAPEIRDACVYYRPFLPARSFPAARGRGVHWVLLRIDVPQRMPAGDYRGKLRLTMGSKTAALPVAVEVAAVPDGAGKHVPTFGVGSDGNGHDVYRSLNSALPAARQARISKDILARLYAEHLNAAFVSGPTLSGTNAQTGPMVDSLRRRLPARRAGKTVVDLRTAFRQLHSGPIQKGTARYRQAIRNVVAAAIDLSAKARLGDYALLCCQVTASDGVADAARLVAAVRGAKGAGTPNAKQRVGDPAPAVMTYASVLAGAGAQRRALFADLDTLICLPNHKDLGQIGEEFKKAGAGKTLLLHTHYPDVYTTGFYAWAVGADGLVFARIFSARSQFNPFWFDGQALLTPTAKGDFEPTLGLLKARQGISDYRLARRCAALVKSAKARKIDTAALEKVLTSIQVAADAKPPGFQRGPMRATSVPPEQLNAWREALLRAARDIGHKAK